MRTSICTIVCTFLVLLVGLHPILAYSLIDRNKRIATIARSTTSPRSRSFHSTVQVFSNDPIRNGDRDCSNKILSIQQPSLSQRIGSSGSSCRRRRSLWTMISRTIAIAATTTTTTTSWLSLFPMPAMASTEDGTSINNNVVDVEMRTFVDPMGLFALNLPKRYFVLRRSNKGDLPDAKTAQGRRGSNIFNAGDMSKAEVIAVEYFPARLLLTENGINLVDITASTTTPWTTITDIGEPKAIANLIVLRRDQDRASSSGTRTTTQILPDSLQLDNHGRAMSFQMTTEIAVQKPELLREQYGVDKLIRVTTVKVILVQGQDTSNNSNGNLLVIFASALESDWNGSDGAALQEAVRSFRSLEMPISLPSERIAT